MAFQDFVTESGLKILAMARLSQCEYSVVLYLLNCSVSGLTQLITTEQEFASLIGYDEETLDRAMTNLAERNIISIKYGEYHQPADRRSIRVGMKWDTNEWQLTFDEDVTSQDAIVFPFRRDSNLTVLPSTETQTPTIKHPLPTWKRIVEAYLEGRDEELADEAMDKAERDAKILIDTHPVDQVILMLRHFGDRVPTLSLLASSWQHYQSIFEEETEKVNLMEARHKHHELDHRLRDSVDLLLKQKSSLKLNDEEITVLEILYNHRHPRRQLFWAYQTRARYPNLKSFFEDNSFLMLPVTSSGAVVKKRPHRD
ncbi:hypothetical protein [Pseudobacteriovorax antillogorgiicola]|uniref:Uncharacterized protein n=1 Tax=Pseudobacteriovorax antillogorgiicola TaxID=1513793 RepID=A0A1Y6BCP2_9BACT|nr:hypothetical protein [Pseudobacteriovorax antillogorgiicola]TCS58588.1 hypothetical protein EDD56_102101 [Pseudobacteriovorax antillogorgiicola]SME97185.1 hypothetical protein SAMN06296036_102342 [Pseudobacteriovorax antillogorgiicola]